jgi:hypothetical protein
MPNTAPNAGAQARAQANVYDSLFSDTKLELNDGSSIAFPQHPDLGMLDDDQMDAYEDLVMEIETYDREEDIFIPEQRLLDSKGNETGVVLPSSTERGQVKRPFRKDGVRVKPAHSVRVAKIALGEEGYQRLRAGGRSAKDVWRIWGRQAAELADRSAADDKSDGGALGLAAVSETDSE